MHVGTHRGCDSMPKHCVDARQTKCNKGEWRCVVKTTITISEDLLAIGKQAITTKECQNG